MHSIIEILWQSSSGCDFHCQKLICGFNSVASIFSEQTPECIMCFLPLNRNTPQLLYNKIISCSEVLLAECKSLSPFFRGLQKWWLPSYQCIVRVTTWKEAGYSLWKATCQDSLECLFVPPHLPGFVQEKDLPQGGFISGGGGASVLRQPQKRSRWRCHSPPRRGRCSALWTQPAVLWKPPCVVEPLWGQRVNISKCSGLGRLSASRDD